MRWRDRTAVDVAAEAMDFLFHDRSQSKNCLSKRAEIDVPTTPAVPAPGIEALPAPTVPTLAAPVVPHAAVLVVGGEIVGTGGAAEFGAAPTTGNTLGNGTAGAEPTPRLLISVEPNGIPVRAPPPGVVGDVAAEVGIDDEAMLLEPEPHIPDIPDVSSAPEAVDVPDVTGISAVTDDGVVPDVTILPVIVAAVAGVAAPGAIPPPSKLAVDPYIPDGDIPEVEHVVPPVVITPVVGIAIVPVTPVGTGLSPGDVSSVEFERGSNRADGCIGAQSKRRGGAHRRRGRDRILDLGESGAAQQGPSHR